MIASILLAVALTPPPTYLVERVVSGGGETRRVSVFRDGNAVLVTRGATGDTMSRATLSPAELRVLLQVIEESYPAIAAQRSDAARLGATWVELRVAPPDREPVIRRMPVAEVARLGWVRLAGALDGIESRLAAPHPDREDLSTWVPAVGDRARLESGEVIEVIEVFDGPSGPVVKVRVNDGVVLRFLPSSELRAIAVRREPR